MGTAIKHPVPDRVKSSFVIFDIRALWRSAGTVCFIAVFIMATVGAWQRVKKAPNTTVLQRYTEYRWRHVDLCTYISFAWQSKRWRHQQCRWRWRTPRDTVSTVQSTSVQRAQPVRRHRGAVTPGRQLTWAELVPPSRPYRPLSARQATPTCWHRAPRIWCAFRAVPSQINTNKTRLLHHYRRQSPVTWRQVLLKEFEFFNKINL